MSRTFLPALFFLLVFFCTTSCQQDEGAPDQKQLLAKTWLVASQVVQRNDGPKEDVYAQLEDCQKDDELIFFENGTYELNPGKDECQISVMEEGTWELYDKQLFIAEQEYEVQQLSSTVLVLGFKASKGDDKIVTTTTYKAK
ncbi:hypothetical protein TH61_05850 [Rufibacter sp. DG15C]|uniref:lipocalin family protein n=1 Tax=Rufibacter sp. DG15C TaxID=1379909 RepID=UPI00078B6A11|nr:lipocalin family protein [Rufibacter sp. DG15C]AMM50797.1 hypothetical protein TH61_05850 [Rufibacter sp. DG15C]